MTVVLALFWFCASVAWAAGLPKLKDKTDPDDLCSKSGSSCSVTDKPNYAGLIISVVSIKQLDLATTAYYGNFLYGSTTCLGIFFSFLVSSVAFCGEQTCGLFSKKPYGTKNQELMPLQFRNLMLRSHIKKYLEKLHLE